MSAVRYPIAANASGALNAPLGRAARASEALSLAGAEVVFVSEAVGPAFATREAALDAYVGRLDDERPGRGLTVAAEDCYCVLRQVVAGPPSGAARAARPMRPTYADGRRWPQPPAPPKTVWRLSVSYWRLAAPDDPRVFEGPAAAPLTPPRRRLPADADAQALRARLESPLTAAKPQKALDVGLFEVRPPEAPHILMPDE
jgi:hypothetical protein